MDVSGTKSLPWNDNTVYAIGVYELIGRSLGIWPLQCDIGAEIRFLGVITLQLILNYNLIQEFVNGCVSTANGVDFIGVFGTTTASLLKVSVLRMHRKEMNCLLESTISDWSMSHDDRSLEIMHKYAHISRIVSICQLSSSYASAVIIVASVPPMLGERTNENLSDTNITALRNIPIGSGCSAVDMSTFVYLGFYVFQFFQLLILVTCIMGCDTLFFGMSMHLCAQFELLKIHITQLGEHLEERKFKEVFAALIERHNHLTRNVNFVEDIFHLMILAQLASSTLHIGLMGIEILFELQNGDYMRFLYSTTAIGVLLLQIYLYSYTGECLTSQVKETRDAAYNCSWYNYPPRFAKDVLFVIVRTNYPFHLTAGKIYRINIESFASFVKTMASFFSVLKITILG